MIVAVQLVGMPAHSSEDAVGRKQSSDGSVITATMWRSNQLADLMAKHAAESVRLDQQDRSWLIHRERQLCELCVFLGRLTHAANNHALPCLMARLCVTPMEFGGKNPSLRSLGLSG